MRKWWEEYKVDVPEGEKGIWKVERFEVSDADSTRSSISVMKYGRGFVPPGTYTRLDYVKGPSWNGPMMSDTPDEIADHLEFIRKAQGRVLIHGLGLGMCLAAAANKREVKHVMCIEKDPDVIALVAPHWKERFGNKIEIIEEDALTWKPVKGAWWDAVWHDIWPTICLDNWPEIVKLHRRFGRRSGWQGSWCRARLELQRERERSWY